MSLYAITIFLSAFLLFQIQPMIAKMILPWFGGSAAVWITAMLFFQTALLGGYLYAHWLIKKLSPGGQSITHVVLLCASVLLLPVAPSLAWKPAGAEDPIFRILGLLVVSVGLPYFLLSTTTPLIQAWYARKFKTALPYRLFALSNLASLAGLLAYPVLVEPNVTLRQQSLGWSAAYLVFAALAAAAAVMGTKTERREADVSEERTPAADTTALTVRERVLWLLLAACSSTFLLAVTNHLTQNVASIPFLWVLPLSLYLLSFILTFDFERLYHRKLFFWLLAVSLLAMAHGLAHWNSHTNLKIVIPVFCSGLFFVCLFCHGELARRKPSARHLTSFYLMLSAGGALGGLLVGLAAPKYLSGYFELPIALIACAVLALSLIEYRKWRLTTAVGFAAAAAVVYASLIYASSYRESSLLMSRNFYGGLRVQEYDRGTKDENRVLAHGTVDHGSQFTLPGRRREHITYYSPRSGVGLAIDSLRRSPMRMGVIGLGAGSLASFAEPGDLIRFYELNPSVEDIARREFTYLEECRGRAEVVLGDGRLSLEREPAQNYDLLVADAFSGDAVPVHLLSLQAMELYFRHVKPDGIVAFNITNTHLDLAPVILKIASALGKHVAIVSNDSDLERKYYRARWALVSTEPITSSAILDAAEEPAPRDDIRVWTDDYSNLFQILK